MCLSLKERYIKSHPSLVEAHPLRIWLRLFPLVDNHQPQYAPRSAQQHTLTLPIRTSLLHNSTLHMALPWVLFFGGKQQPPSNTIIQYRFSHLYSLVSFHLPPAFAFSFSFSFSWFLFPHLHVSSMILDGFSRVLLFLFFDAKSAS